MAGFLETSLTRAWLRRGPLACALLPLALVFGALSGARRAAYRLGLAQAERLPVPVIVVGNIFVGGTGKTPLTIWLAQALRAQGRHPGVISRGFGRGAEGVRAVDAHAQASEVGDEPLLIARRTACPVFVGRRRAEAGRALLAAHPEVDILIADDGLQHYALARDAEVMLFDARGAGNGWLLPAGPLREPRGRRRDATVVNAPELTAALAAATGARDGPVYAMRLVGAVAQRLSDPSERVPLAQLSGRRVCAAAGIGNPGRFFAMLRAAGLEPQELPLPDHYDFSGDPFAGIGADVILITEKDAVKCGQLEHLKSDPRLWVVPVAAQIDAALVQQLLEKCRGRPTA
ncbi:MAG TPA: tetraacyldisaccharide 4'-kinase [Telluria sp.]|nr:tetraacyldisaccharide 4'-kinase [Telluria sp.]